MDKSSSCSNESNDSAKRKRGSNGEPNTKGDSGNDDDEGLRSNARSKKRTIKRKNVNVVVYDSGEEDYFKDCLDEDLDFDNIENTALDKNRRNLEGIVLQFDLVRKHMLVKHSV